MDTSSSIKEPQCVICKNTFRNMEIMNKHMKNVHKETDHMRLERLTQMLKADGNKDPMKRKIYSYTECGLVCETDEGRENHMVQHYSGPEIKKNVLQICQHCGDGITEENISIHMKSKHSVTHADAETEATITEDYVVKGYPEKERNRRRHPS